MKRAKPVLILFLIVIAAVVVTVPAVQDEAAWVWALSRDHAADYMDYMQKWPKGSHIAEARIKHDQREWMENKKSAISQAYEEAAHPDAATDAEYDREKTMRKDSFFWKRATNLNTVDAYQDYLRQFPNGQFVRQAQTQMGSLNHPASQ
ncbi:MAG TPA: hypothetical protein VGN61_00410 [Verrucomicrobiae bacterium]|jgi:hypothetical protein